MRLDHTHFRDTYRRIGGAGRDTLPSVGGGIERGAAAPPQIMLPQI